MATKPKTTKPAPKYAPGAVPAYVRPAPKQNPFQGIINYNKAKTSPNQDRYDKMQTLIRQATTPGKGGGGGYTGGGGGGGGGGVEYTADIPDFGDGGVTPEDEDIDAARQKALQDALAAIGAQFGMNQAELQSQQGDLSKYFLLQQKQIQEQGELARRAAIEDAVRRGIGRSSIYEKNLGDVVQKEADTKAQLAEEYGTEQVLGAGKEGSRARRIQSALKLLVQQKQAADAQAQSTSAQGQLDLETLLALIGTGISGTNFAGG